MADDVQHQFSLFGYQPPQLPRKKGAKITVERIRAMQAELKKGKDMNVRTVVEGLRDLNDVLENWERRITHKPE